MDMTEVDVWDKRVMGQRRSYDVPYKFPMRNQNVILPAAGKAGGRQLTAESLLEEAASSQVIPSLVSGCESAAAAQLPPHPGRMLLQGLPCRRALQVTVGPCPVLSASSLTDIHKSLLQQTVCT